MNENVLFYGTIALAGFIGAIAGSTVAVTLLSSLKK